MINVISYYSKKLDNLSSVEKSDTGFNVRIKHFNPETGAAIADEVIPVTLTDAQQSLTDLQDEIAKTTQFIADLQAL